MWRKNLVKFELKISVFFHSQASIFSNANTKEKELINKFASYRIKGKEKNRKKE